MTVFNDLNVESSSITSNRDLNLVRDILAWTCTLEYAELKSYLEESEENIENFFIVLNVFSLLYDKVGVTFDTIIATSLIRLAQKLPGEMNTSKMLWKKILIEFRTKGWTSLNLEAHLCRKITSDGVGVKFSKSH